MPGRVCKVGVNTYSRSTDKILSLRDAMSEQKHTQKIAEFISERCNVGGLAEGAALLDRPSKGK
jgi:hypothetical protein